MTNLSKFDGHTPGVWSVQILEVNDDGDSATTVDLNLLNAAPNLLARVKELESMLDNISKHSTCDAPILRYEIDKLLEREWL